MATLNMRYGGQLVSIPEGANFNANYGTAKLNIKVNSTSTMKLGLTTNTNAQAYCKLRLRVGGKEAYIGRVYTSSMAFDGPAVNPNITYFPYETNIDGYTVTSYKNAYSTSVLVQTSYIPSGSPGFIGGGTYESYSKSVSSSTRSSTSLQYTSTRNSGAGSGTAAANPTVRIITNATGSSYTTRTASANIASYTYYSFSVSRFADERSETHAWSYGWPAVGAKKIFTKNISRTLKISQNNYYMYISATNLNIVNGERNQVTATYYDISRTHTATTSKSASTTRRLSATSASNQTTASTAGGYKTVTSTVSDYVIANNSETFMQNHIVRTAQNTYTTKQTTSASIVSTSKSTYLTRRTMVGWMKMGMTSLPQAIQTLYRSSVRWSYWWTSCSKYSVYHSLTDSYYTTSHYFCTLTASYTAHNMNI